jgi:hypothetical protein
LISLLSLLIMILLSGHSAKDINFRL